MKMDAHCRTILSQFCKWLDRKRKQPRPKKRFLKIVNISSLSMSPTVQNTSRLSLDITVLATQRKYWYSPKVEVPQWKYEYKSEFYREGKVLETKIFR